MVARTTAVRAFAALWMALPLCPALQWRAAKKRAAVKPGLQPRPEARRAQYKPEKPDKPDKPDKANINLDSLRAQAGAWLVRMTGSGSTCFALFHEKGPRDAALAAVQQAHPTWWSAGADIR